MLLRRVWISLLIVWFSSALAETYPVSWSSALKLKSLSDIPQQLQQPINEVILTGPSSGPVTVKTCVEYLKLTREGYFPANNHEIAASSWLISACYPLRFLQTAIPAQQSYLRSFDLVKNYQQLPADVVFPDLESESQPQGDLATAYPDAKLKLRDNNSIELIESKIGMRAIVTLLAWGDYNHDGYDEMLIEVANYATDGSFHSYQMYVVAKTNSTAKITEINAPELNPVTDQ